MEKTNQAENIESQMKSKVQNIYSLEMNDIVVIDYQIDENNPIKINFLKDYSEFLFQSKYYDEKIVNWQVENKDTLMSLGLDMNTLKKAYNYFHFIFKLNSQY